MTKILSWSFSLAPPAPPAPAPKRHDYSYNEFRIDLTSHWKQVPTSEDNTILFYSEARSAGITISADFFEVQDAKAAALADVCLDSRLEALERLTPGRVSTLQRTVKPHSGGVGLELGFVAEVPGEHVYLYLGHVTTRKLLNFTLVCKPGKEAAAALFNETIAHYRPKLP